MLCRFVCLGRPRDVYVAPVIELVKSQPSVFDHRRSCLFGGDVLMFRSPVLSVSCRPFYRRLIPLPPQGNKPTIQPHHQNSQPLSTAPLHHHLQLFESYLGQGQTLHPGPFCSPSPPASSRPPPIRVSTPGKKKVTAPPYADWRPLNKSQTLSLRQSLFSFSFSLSLSCI
ncbi:hypothetical protein BJ508DRAFT_28817 [Ascobolus immersus RN42]|uniref:Uncharacterized protein n=1 Tax=Ascobolus immersus RN42 TaxID=1160509 RepID=A0A3N4HS88_ASCIM|nr:hypothetical protein BJ508DRAFT_28817 [Ascobolus immersus RN42]